MNFRIEKIWQNKKRDILIRLSKISGPDYCPKKFFLKLSVKKLGKYYVAILKEKPQDLWGGEAAFVSLCRKYVRGSIDSILITQEKTHLWIPVSCKDGRWIFHVLQSGSAEMQLISPENDSLIRMGKKGVFTKRKPSQNVYNKDLNTKNILEDLLLNLKEEESDKSFEVNEIEVDKEDDIIFSDFQKDVRKKMLRKKKTLGAVIDKLSSKVPDPAGIKELEEKVFFLQENSFLADDYTDVFIIPPKHRPKGFSEILLDSKYTVGQNIKKMFELLKKHKKSRELQSARLKLTKKDYTKICEVCDHLKLQEFTDSGLSLLSKEYKLSFENQKKNKRESEAHKSFRVFTSSDNVTILVGKGAKDNDVLTKQAKANDYWLHAIAVSGSHVIIPAKALKGGVLPPNTRKEAAILALHFSKVKKDFSGEVHFTKKSSLRKSKSMPVGLWNIIKSETLYISYAKSEVDAIFSRS